MLIIGQFIKYQIQRMDDEPTPSQPNTFPVYSKYCFFKVKIVLDHSQKMKKNMEDFSSAFNKRIDAELTYQKNLLQCSKMLEKYIEPTSSKSVSYIASGFKVDNEQRAAQAYQLASSLKSEVIDHVNQVTKEYESMIKKIEKLAKKLNKDYSYYQQNFEKAYKNYTENDNAAKELIMTKNIYRFTSEFPQQKKNRLISKTMESIKEKIQYEKLYRNSVSQFNQLAQIYTKEIKDGLDELETKERELIKIQSDGIRKLIVCEVSMFKNVEYDLINISKQMEKLYPENDILEFKKAADSSEDTEKDRNLELKTIDSDKSLLNLSLRNIEEEYYPWLLSIKNNKTMRKVLEIRMKVLMESNNSDNEQKIEEEELTQVQSQQRSKRQEEQKTVKQNTTPIQNGEQQDKNSLDLLKQQFSNCWSSLPKEIFVPPVHPLFGDTMPECKNEQILQDFEELTKIIHKNFKKQPKKTSQQSSSIIEARKSKQSPKSSLLKYKKKHKSFLSLISKSHLLRIIAYLFIEEFRIQHHVQMTSYHHHKAAELVSTLIDEADEKKDVFVIKGMLGLIFTFYTTENEQHKKLLYQHNLVKDVEVWKKNEYWDAAIFESTYQQMASFSIQNGETQAQTFLRQKNIIFSQLASYCHYMLMLGMTSRNVRIIVGRYCRLYEMSEDQNRDLSKMISNTTKQIKETQMITQAKSQV